MTLLACALSAPSAFCAGLFEVSGGTWLGFDTSSYLYSGRTKRESVFPSLTARYETFSSGSLVQTALSGEILFALQGGGSGPYFEIPEAYIGSSEKLSPFQFFVGRKMEGWSRLDERWGFGIWQPRFRWDYIRPETVGLSGVFLNYKGNGLRLLGFATPFFIPERGVPTNSENGIVVSNSPWFVPPPTKIAIINKDTPVQYTIRLPEIKDIVLNPGAAMMAYVGHNSGPWLSAAYAFKPINQLLLAYDGNLYPTEKDPNQQVAKADIFPRVLNHHLVSAEAGARNQAMGAWVSALWDRPIRDKTPSRWTTQEVQNGLALSGTVEMAVAGTKSNPTKVDMSYLRVYGANASDGGFSKVNGSVFDSRYPYTEALSVGVRGGVPDPFRLWGDRLSATTQLIQDFANRGNIFSSEIQYRHQESWMIAFGFDVLGSDAAPDPSRAGNDFINRYRANDRVHAGVSYVF